MSFNVTQADILEWAKNYDGPKFHAAFCDAPYHLTEMNKRFSKPGSAGAQYGTDGAFQRASKGFMAATWDGGDIAFRPETWAAIARHIHPGGFIASFAGSRGWHRMAVAMEDAGLLIHPTIFLWGYGSGFPKATRIDAQIDADAFRSWLKVNPDSAAALRAHVDDYRLARRAAKAEPGPDAADRVAGAKRALDNITQELKARAGLAPRVVGQKKHQPKFAAAELGYREKDNGFNSKDRDTFDLTEAATDMGRDWAGHRYGGQAIKPAVEPIIIAQVPYAGRPVDCITSTGAGALNIDGARIGTDEVNVAEPYLYTGNNGNSMGAASERLRTNGGGARHDAGRWPANLALTHHPECNGTCHEACPVRRLGEQSGEGASKASQRGAVNVGTFGGTAGAVYGARDWKDDYATRGHDDSGTAARYFYNADWQAERLEAADPCGYFAKASAAEREAGLDPMQVRIMRELYGDEEEAEAGDLFEETTIDDGRETPIDNPYQRGETTRRNIHPTIKPIALNRWLATLLLPPERYAPRRLLIPFAGAGSEVIGAMLAGWEAVEGIELEADHVRIAQARIAYWSLLRHRFLNPDSPIKLRAAKAVPAGQLELF